jgi:acetolactate synthase-1/2/3 large subunit
MNVQELATAVEEQLPVKVLLLDNASLGMVRQQQDLFWGGRRTAVDLGALARLGAAARGVRLVGALDRRRRRGRGRARRDPAEDGPALLHVRIAPRRTACRCSARRRRAGDDRVRP